MDKQLKLWIALWAATLVVAVLLIPSVLVKREKVTTEPNVPIPHLIAPPVTSESEDDVRIAIPVYLTAEKRIASIPLEQYVKGVIAAEMPIDFELEAMKAQAIAARTYAWRRIVEQDNSHVPVEGAWVTDSVAHQVYYTDDMLQQLWDADAYATNMKKLNQAINETKDLIVTYEQRPINATFFSTSNGYTENSEDYWNVSLPYLRSVPSPWDAAISPRYKETISMPVQTFNEKLGIAQQATKAKGTVQTLGVGQSLAYDIEKTAGKRIKTLTISGKSFTGREVREKLELNSSQFHIEKIGDNVQITTYGFGHGVGMSQWGANGMALEGRGAEEIIKHYYQGVEIEKIKILQNI